MSTHRFGLLRAKPHDVLRELLYDPGYAKDMLSVFDDLLAVDCAHVLMLRETGILNEHAARALLALNLDMQRRRDAGEDVLEPAADHRGLYAVYEQAQKDRLGIDIGGSAHVGRSRNDINATIFRLRLRREVLSFLRHGNELLRTILSVASEHLHTVMSGFTHLQPAQPSTLAHTLAGFLSEATRSLELLARHYPLINQSPLGAAAALGTSHPIRRDRTASLLGFDGVIENSFDAVGSRDVGVHVLSAVAMFGIGMTRLASDLQLWSNATHGFLTFPDSLVSTSSIMPQKRNAYVLENVRGQAIHAVGALTNVMLSMKSAPFTNGIEVSGESPGHIWPALTATTRSTRLLNVLLAHVQVQKDAMRSFVDEHQTTMTALADALVREHGLAFRIAHGVVSDIVRDGLAKKSATDISRRIEESIQERTGQRISVAPTVVEEAIDADQCVAAARYGGGPAPDAVKKHLAAIHARVDRLGTELHDRETRLARAHAQRMREAAFAADQTQPATERKNCAESE